MSEPNQVDASRFRAKRLVIFTVVILVLVTTGSWILWQSHIFSLKYFTAVVVSGVAFLLAAFARAAISDVYHRLKERLISRNSYIAVVVSKESVDFPIPGEFLRGFHDAFPGGRTYIETRAGKKVDIQTLEDLGSVDEAARIAKKLVADRDCILVIGNSNSTLTDITLDIFLGTNNPPPYILPIATANEIMIKAKTGNHGAVLRMVPDNAGQAQMIQRLTRDISTDQRVAIYGDQENAFYSINLSRDIASRIRSGGGRILREESIGPTNSVYSSLAAWSGSCSPPDVIIFVGVAHHSLLLIDQCLELAIEVPLIFTDGCMVSSLLTNIKKVKNRAFVLSPVGGGQKNSDQTPTYESVGKDAYSLASRIITNCSDCSRAGLRRFISQNKDKEAIRVSNGFAGEYHFNAEGNNTAMTYKVYEITGGELRRMAAY